MKRALIVKLGAIGDVVMAIPAVSQLVTAGYQVDWIANPAAASVLRCYSLCNVIEADEHAIVQGSRGERVSALRAVWKQLAGTYDLVATLYYDRRYRLLSLPVRGARHIRLIRNDRALDLLQGRHHTDEFARVLLHAAAGAPANSGPVPQSLAPIRPFQLPVPPLAPGTGKRVVLAPGGARNLLRDDFLRRWPIRNYVELGRILGENGWEVVLTGGPGDVWVREAFADLPRTDLIDQLSLPQLIALFDASQAAITHDSGPLHLAGVTSCALLGIFGPVDPWSRLPRRQGVMALWGGEGFACRPCYNGSGYAACRDNQCMAQVTPMMAFTALQDLLRKHERGCAAPEVRLPLSTSASYPEKVRA